MGISDSLDPGPGIAAGASARKRSHYRWVVCCLLCWMSLIIFMDRTNISIAAPEIMNEFGLTKTEMGMVFSAFAWAYMLGGVPGGWLGDRYGPRIILTVLVLFWSLMTMATAHAIGFASLVAIRVAFGLGEAGAWPAATRGMQPWFSKSERGFVNGVTHASGSIATSLVPLVGVIIVSALGWRALFHIFGLFGIVWAICWYFLYRDRPEQHRSVNEEELAYIQDTGAEAEAPAAADKAKVSVPWRKILASPNVWYLAVSFTGYNYTSYFFYYWLPTYLMEHHHISLAAMGPLASVPLAAGAVGAVMGGVMTDFLYRRTKNLKWSRCSVGATAMLGAAIFIIPASIISSPAVVILFLSCSVFFVAIVLAPTWAVAMDISAGHSGSVSGVMNFVGQGGGALSAIIFGALTQNGYWSAPFFITSGVLVVDGLIWAFLINPERSVVGR